MKRCLFALCALLLLAGCGRKVPASPTLAPDPTPAATAATASPAPTSTEPPAETAAPAPEATPHPLADSDAPQYFDSAEYLIRVVNAGSIYNSVSSLTEFYRPKTVPKGFELRHIAVQKNSVALRYDKYTPDDFCYYLLEWQRNLNEASLQSFVSWMASTGKGEAHGRYYVIPAEGGLQDVYWNDGDLVFHAVTPANVSSASLAAFCDTERVDVVPTPEPDAGLSDLELLDFFLEKLLAADSWETRYMIHPGSGPWTVKMYPEESGQALREVFSDVRWTSETDAAQQARSAQAAPVYDSRSVDLHTADSSDVLFLDYGQETARLSCGGRTVYFHAPDVDQRIEALFRLSPIPELRYAETVVPWQADADAAAQSYVEAFQQRYLDSGFVTGLRLEDVTVKDRDVSAPGYLLLTLEYALKPARPELTIWQKYMEWYDVDADGWIHIRHEVQLSRCDDDLLRFDYCQVPMEE